MKHSFLTILPITLMSLTYTTNAQAARVNNTFDEHGAIVLHLNASIEYLLANAKMKNDNSGKFAKISCSTFDINYACPAQVSWVIEENRKRGDNPEKSVRAIAISVRSLKDGSWVAARDKNVKPYQKKKVNLDDIDKFEFEELKRDPTFPVYDIEDYVSRDTNGEIFYLLTLKSPPNKQLIELISFLGITKRTLVVVSNPSQSAWLYANQLQVDNSKILFTARYNNPESLSVDAKKVFFKNGVSVIEVDSNEYTETLIKEVKKTGKKLMIDSRSCYALEKNINKNNVNYSVSWFSYKCFDKVEN